MEDEDGDIVEEEVEISIELEDKKGKKDTVKEDSPSPSQSLQLEVNNDSTKVGENNDFILKRKEKIIILLLCCASFFIWSCVWTYTVIYVQLLVRNVRNFTLISLSTLLITFPR